MFQGKSCYFIHNYGYFSIVALGFEVSINVQTWSNKKLAINAYSSNATLVKLIMSHIGNLK